MEKQPSLAGRIHKGTLDLHCLFSCAAMRDISPGIQNPQKGAVIMWITVLLVSLSLDQECPQMSPGRDTWNWIYLEKHGYLEFQCLGASSCPSRGGMVFSQSVLDTPNLWDGSRNWWGAVLCLLSWRSPLLSRQHQWMKLALGIAVHVFGFWGIFWSIPSHPPSLRAECCWSENAAWEKPTC